MGLGVWFSEDIGQVLAGLASAGSGNGPAYVKALADVALALGVPFDAVAFPVARLPVLLIESEVDGEHVGQ